MSETKVKEYKRETIVQKALELLERIEEPATSPSKEWYVPKNVVLFGSFINTDKPKIHDLDVFVEIENTEKYKDEASAFDNNATFEISKACEEGKGGLSFLLQCCYLNEKYLKYLKNKCGILSFHPFKEFPYVIKENDEVLWLVKDGVINENAREEILKHS